MSYALITGGSKGIGYAIAEALAKRKYDLVLIARHTDTLEAAKKELEIKYGVKVSILSSDLSREDAAEEVASWCLENNIPLSILCNVAGIGGTADFLNSSLEEMQFMIRLNIQSGVALTRELLPLLQKNTPAFILNTASLAAFAPMPVKNIYSATKSAVLFFSYSLRYQLKKQDISVSALCPGPVFTKPEIEKTTIEKMGRFGKMMAVEPARVGEIAVRRLLNKRMIIVPGVLAKIISGILRVLPRRLATYLYSRRG
jgi:short-subunit dehydrogenase